LKQTTSEKWGEQNDDTSQHVIIASLDGKKQACFKKESSITTVARTWKM
jgi:hypothetical protein